MRQCATKEAAGLIISVGPIVRFLRQQCAELGGDINSSNVRCRPCRSNQFAGFDPEYGIVLCSDQLASRSRKDLEDSLAHEMIHAYDYLRFKFDRTNMKHAACTEVCVWTFIFFILVLII